MTARRIRRCAIAFVAVVSLLFAQWSLARYVCPGQSDAAAMAAMMEAGVPCSGMDQVQPLLCHQHAAEPAQSCQAAKAALPDQPVIAQVLVLPAVPEPGFERAIPVTATAEAQPAPDPLFLSTLRLRV
jgi:hypothetical protein